MRRRTVAALATILILAPGCLDSTSPGGDNIAPTVTVNQAVAQVDPATVAPVGFTVQFNEIVTGFTAADVSFTGSTGTGTRVAVVTGTGATYTVAVSGMTSAGLLVVNIPAGAAQDVAGNASLASTSTDNQVTYTPDLTPPTVTIDQAPTQVDPASSLPITYRVVFSEPVVGFSAADISFTGSTGTGTRVATVTGTGPVYTVTVTGLTSSGTLVASIAAGAAADLGGNQNTASTSTDNQVSYVQDLTAPTVTIDQAVAQVDPVAQMPITFTVQFSEVVTGFTSADVSFAGSTGTGTRVATVTGTGTTYLVSVTGMTSAGLVVASVPAGAANDLAGNPSVVSTSTDNQVTYNLDVTAPGVTIDQAAGQVDPFAGSPIVFTVVFTEIVTDFTASDVSFAGSTVGGTLVTAVTGSGANYTVSVSGMTGSGTVVASIPAGRVVDLAGNANVASTSTDNTVTRP